MKVGVLTFHYAHNYGAMLQAYALVSKLNSLGFEAEVIDYRLPCIYENHEKLSFSRLFDKYKRNDSSLISLLKAIKNYYRNRNRDVKWDRFEKFLNVFLPKSRRVFKQDLSGLNYNAFICGSDQIWNPIFTDGVNPIYYLQNLSKSSIRIAYAASNGQDKIEELNLERSINYINSLNAISVREKGLKDFLTSKINKPVEHVLDPIFLLEKEDWETVLELPNEKDYILVYSFHEDDLFYESLKLVEAQFKMPIIKLCYEKDKNISSHIKQIDNCGPREFLGYFRNASFVITNTFHGTAFSVLFEKQFRVVPPKRFRGRIDSVLSEIKLSGQVIEDISQANLEKTINYNEVLPLLGNWRALSIQFLLNALEN